MTTLYMEGRSFEDLFTEIHPWDAKRDGHPDDVEPDTDIGHYLTVGGAGGHRSFWARPAPSLVKWVMDNMLHLDNDRKFFEVVVREDGSALILVKYNQILGSRWLTIVPAASLPWMKEAA